MNSDIHSLGGGGQASVKCHGLSRESVGQTGKKKESKYINHSQHNMTESLFSSLSRERKNMFLSVLF